MLREESQTLFVGLPCPAGPSLYQLPSKCTSPPFLFFVVFVFVFALPFEISQFTFICTNNQLFDPKHKAIEENDFIEKWLPVLLRGASYKKHGTILVSNVRLQLHPSCRRLEYWKPPHSTRNNAAEVKGIDVNTMRSVSNSQGLRLR